MKLSELKQDFTVLYLNLAVIRLVLCASAMESKASFAARAKEVGIGEEVLAKLVAAGLDTFNKLAYICAANPNSGDDAKLKAAIEDLLGQAVTAVNMISFRQLWFEAYKGQEDTA